MIILIEGPDGSGKSTLVKALAAQLEAAGKSVRAQEFPSHSGPIGAFIREKVFSGQVDLAERAMLPLMVADALDLDHSIAAWDEQHDVVILDRHSLVSAWAYQLGAWSIDGVARIVSPGMFQALPDLVVILDLPAEGAVSRREDRGGETNPLYEKDLDYAKQLRDRYLAFAAMNQGLAPVVVLDAMLETGELAGAIISMISEPPSAGSPQCDECSHPVSAHNGSGCTISAFNPAIGVSTPCSCSEHSA